MTAASPQPLSRGGEKGLFGEAAARLCGAAAMLLGWRPAEFWDSTPEELALALEAMHVPTDGPDRAMIEELLRRCPDQ